VTPSRPTRKGKPNRVVRGTLMEAFAPFVTCSATLTRAWPAIAVSADAMPAVAAIVCTPLSASLRWVGAKKVEKGGAGWWRLVCSKSGSVRLTEIAESVELPVAITGTATVRSPK
jgi:hypothetical protein